MLPDYLRCGAPDRLSVGTRRIAAAEINTVPGTALWYDLYALTTDNRADREKAIRTLEQRSLVRGTAEVQADDQLLLLVTCLDGDAERLVVAARRLREGEM